MTDGRRPFRMTRLLSRYAGPAGGVLLAMWGAVTIVFLATRLIGDPATLLLPVGAGPEQLATLRADLGLDRPLAVQYGRYLLDALTGNFGTSFQHGRPAMDLVLERLPATASLAGIALTLGITFGAIMGTLGALTRSARVRTAVMTLAALGQATPAFWLGIMLIMVFSVFLGWLPTGGADGPTSVILPAITLSVAIAASVARLLRASLVEVLAEDHVRTARAKGLPPATILIWHVLRNGLTPVLTLAGILAGELLGGAIIVETVFAWPGVGRLLIQAIAARDFPVVQAAVLVVAGLYVMSTLLVDLLYGLIDPRVRLSGRAA